MKIVQEANSKIVRQNGVLEPINPRKKKEKTKRGKRFSLKSLLKIDKRNLYAKEEAF